MNNINDDYFYTLVDTLTTCIDNTKIFIPMDVNVNKKQDKIEYNVDIKTIEKSLSKIGINIKDENENYKDLFYILKEISKKFTDIIKQKGEI